MNSRQGYQLRPDRIRSRMQSLGLSNAGLASLLGVTKSTASQLVSGRQRATQERARRLAEALKCPWTALVVRRRREPDPETTAAVCSAGLDIHQALERLQKAQSRLPVREVHAAMESVRHAQAAIQILLDVIKPDTPEEEVDRG